MTRHAREAISLGAAAAIGEIALLALMTTDWSNVGAQALLFAFLGRQLPNPVTGLVPGAVVDRRADPPIARIRMQWIARQPAVPAERGRLAVERHLEAEKTQRLVSRFRRLQIMACQPLIERRRLERVLARRLRSLRKWMLLHRSGGEPLDDVLLEQDADDDEGRDGGRGQGRDRPPAGSLRAGLTGEQERQRR